MPDLLYRGQLPTLGIRFAYTITSSLVKDAIFAHNCDPVSSHIFGRALTAAALSSPLLNEGERYSLLWRYEGATLQSVVIDVSGQSEIRGFINPTSLYDVAEDKIFPDECTISVIKSDDNGTLNSGVTRSIFQDVVNDLSYFFSFSDQLETAMICMIGFNADPDNPVKLSQGLLLQAMPDCDLTVFDQVRQRMEEPACRDLLSEEPTIDNYVERIFQSLIDDKGALSAMTISECPLPVFTCNCSHERVKGALVTLGQDEIDDIKEKNETLKINCQFCNKDYEIAPEEL